MDEKKIILVKDESRLVVESFRRVEELLSRQGLVITFDRINHQDPDSKKSLKPGEVIFFRRTAMSFTGLPG